uniref:protein-tyrosine-phosphatase n=1 Tax=Sinocyclocheilus grahami TaxID=75366 RepID=A0A672RXE4_SINGR
MKMPLYVRMYPGALQIDQSEETDQGKYECVATNSEGTRYSAPANLYVRALPNPPGAPVVMERSATSITLMWDSGNPLPVSYYIIQYRPASSTDPFKEIDAIATTRYSVGGLSPYSHYHFRVMAVNSIGRSSPSQTVEARTAEQAPSSPPRRVRGRMLSGSTAMMQWEEPEEANGQVVGYRVYYTSDSSLPVSQWEKEMVRGANFLNIQDLTPNKTYYIRVLAFTAVGDGPLSSDLHIIAKTGVPSQPTELKAEVKSETSILLSWIPPAHSGTDAITGYELIYRLGDQPEQVHTDAHIQNAEKRTYTVTSLSAEVLYVFRLAARTIWGYGSSAQETIQFLANLTAESINSSSVILRWEPPKSSDRIQGYRISYGDGESVEVDGRLGQKLVTKLKPQSLYTFLLTSKADGTGGLQHRADAMTAPNLLTRKPQLLDKTSSQSIATLQLPTVQGQANVRGFYIVVVPLKRQRGGNFQNLWSDPDEMNIDELLREINGTGHSVRLRRQVEAKPYISAYLQNLPAEFKLGDGRVYGAFMNRPLVNGQECVCFVLAILELGQNTLYSTSPFSDAVLFSDVEPQPIVDEEEGLLWVVGPVLAVIFIIKTISSMSSQHPSDPVELRRINFPTAGMTSHPPVSFSELPAHIERMKANDNLRFSQEYESIDPGQQFSWEHSNLEINKPKNRYANVIAYDHTRVALFNNVPGGDYINANFIDGYRRQGAYIATQGPLPDTFSDLWRLVWEQHTANIIMITKLEEKSRNKCDQYWPSRGTETYGLMQVTLLDTVELATYCVRTFALFKSGSGEKREVRQFQFTAWPDQGVPEHPTPFLAFLRRVKACNPPDAGPIVVHCSAGVGRTGCFIVIDAMLERVKQEKTIDVYGHVTLMRSQRNYMVQTEEQYVFIYDALLEAVSCGNTEVPARNLYAYIQRLSQTEPPEHISGMEQEFKRLANAKAHNSRFVNASLPCNKFKNRLVNIMPYETTRVCLQPIRGVEGSDYVNGSFVDGYRQQRAYIATQGPLAETVEDYWRMLWEHNSTIVVMLTKLREMGREKCHQYWPSDRSARYQYFVVDPMAEYNMPQYILREFKVTDARDGQSRTVRQFQFTDWPEQGVPKSGEGFIDFIGQVHKTKEQFGQDGPITVHCSAGVGRTGVFITLSIVLERMRYEGVVDIFQTVKMLRTQRPAMVQTEEQYQFCYRAGLEYLGSFDHYAT